MTGSNDFRDETGSSVDTPKHSPSSNSKESYVHDTPNLIFCIEKTRSSDEVGVVRGKDGNQQTAGF